MEITDILQELKDWLEANSETASFRDAARVRQCIKLLEDFEG